MLGKLSCHKAFCLMREIKTKQLIIKISIVIMTMMSAIRKKL